MAVRPDTKKTDTSDRAYTAPLHKQLAALCYRVGKSGREVLMVTSSRGRWILPKGWPIDGLAHGDAAMVEAWEEGGVRKGKVAAKPIGKFMATKISEHGDEEACETRVYAVEVSKTSKDYPEADRRERKWVSVKKAANMVTEDGLRAILRKF